MYVLAVSYLDQLDQLSAHAITTGKAAGAAVAIVFILVAYALRRTLGAVFAAVIVAGVVLYAIANTQTLEKNTQDTIGGAATPQGMMYVPPAGVHAGGGGGGGTY